MMVVVRGWVVGIEVLVPEGVDLKPVRMGLAVRSGRRRVMMSGSSRTRFPRSSCWRIAMEMKSLVAEARMKGSVMVTGRVVEPAGEEATTVPEACWKMASPVLETTTMFAAGIGFVGEVVALSIRLRRAVAVSAERLDILNRLYEHFSKVELQTSKEERSGDCLFLS